MTVAEHPAETAEITTDLTGADARFWSKVDTNGDCWEWAATRNADGYGVFYFDRRNQRAHRVAWQIKHGEIPAGLCVLHRCDNPSCVRPDHLFLGTLSDNVQDCIAKRRHSNVAKNKCPLGHPYDAANTYRRRDGARTCRTCARMAWRRWAPKRKSRATQ